jgi:transcription termination factor Rho
MGIDPKQLREMKTGEVAERAKQAGIQNVSQMDKGEMIEAIEQKLYNKPGGGQSQNDPAPPGVPPSQYKNVPGNQS